MAGERALVRILLAISVGPERMDINAHAEPVGDELLASVGS